jgi:hypothetical protein
VFDTDAIHDTVTNNSRMYVPSGITKIRFTCYVRYAANVTGRRFVNLYKNGVVSNDDGVPEFNFNASTTGVTTLAFYSPILTVTPGDYWELMTSQNSGGGLNVTTLFTYFAMELIE